MGIIWFIYDKSMLTVGLNTSSDVLVEFLLVISPVHIRLLRQPLRIQGVVTSICKQSGVRINLVVRFDKHALGLQITHVNGLYTHLLHTTCNKYV